MTHIEKIEKLAKLIEVQKRHQYQLDGFTSECHESAFKVVIKPGKKYTKVDVGDSGKYMIDAAGNIFGIKAYGVIHTGHRYGTLDTIEDFYWGNYVGRRI